MFSLLKQIVASGTWKQCKFCRRALPTKEQHQKNKALAKRLGRSGDTDLTGNEECIADSGYCTYCESKNLTV